MSRKKIAVSLMLSVSAAAGLAVPTAAYADAVSVPGVSGPQENPEGYEGTLCVAGIREEDRGSVTVTAYQLIDTYYIGGKAARYVLTDPEHAPIAAFENYDGTKDANSLITAQEMTNIANAVDAGEFGAGSGIAMTDTDGDGVYTAAAEPGVYIVLVRGAACSVYNPAIVSINITDPNFTAADSVDSGTAAMTGFFSENKKPSYFKSSSTAADARISDSNALVAGSNQPNQKAYISEKGSEIPFSVQKLSVPSYSEDYANPTYRITLDKAPGLGTPKDLAVSMNGKPLSEGEDYTPEAGGITFTESFLRSAASLADDERKLSLSFRIPADDPSWNFAENRMTVTATYSSDPTDETALHTITSSAYAYSFGMDAVLDSQSEKRTESYEFNVTKENGGDMYSARNADGCSTMAFPGALPGNTYSLYRSYDAGKDECTDRIGSAVSDANGHITFTGLGTGPYYLRETKTQPGYLLVKTVYRVAFTPSINSDGIMYSYRVDIDARDKSAGDTDFSNISSTDHSGQPDVKDTGEISYGSGISSSGGSVGADSGSGNGSAEKRMTVLPNTGVTARLMMFIGAAICAAGGGLLLLFSRKPKEAAGRDNGNSGQDKKDA